MLLQKETLNDLRERFRLNIYEIKIWTSLLSRGVAAASELAEISGVPRSRCYDVLESLEKKGFIIMKIGKPIKYIAVHPNAVVERVQKGLQEDAQQQILSVEKLSETDIFRELELLHKTGIKKIDVEDITNSVAGKNNVNRFVKDMMLRARKSIVIATNGEGLKNKAKVYKKIKDNIAKKKVKVKFYSNASNMLNDHKELDITAIKQDARFVSIDNEEIFFIIAENNNPDSYSGVWIKSPYFVSTLSELFEKSLR